MYSKEEKKQNRISFWNKIEADLEGQRNPHGTKVNWMSYNTGLNHIYFRMEADEEGARLCIDIQMPDDGIREIFYQQFEEFSKILTDTFTDEIHWQENFEHSNGCTISRLSLELNDMNILRTEDWNKMHSFLRKNFIKLDRFWCEYGEVFKNLN